METLELVLMIVAGAGVASIMALLAIKGKWNQLRMMAYALMLAAERHIHATGPEKMDAVLDAFYEKLPAFIRKHMDPAAFRSMLQSWYDKAKDWLDDGTVNGSIFIQTAAEVSMKGRVMESVIEKMHRNNHPI